MYTPVLHSVSSIVKSFDLAQRVVDLAKETIQYLSLLNTHTNVYRRIQVFYHHFLTSAIAALFLASTHNGQFTVQCREEFNMSMVLIEDMSAKSHVSQRLWATMNDLKAYTHASGLTDADDDMRPRESAALTMAGMARMSRGAQPPYELLSVPSRHGSIGSASVGHQTTPSPGMNPGFTGPNHAPSRMGSLTPHAERVSPHTGGAPAASGEDVKNGLRLRAEMSRMFEALSNGVCRDGYLHGGDDSFTGSDDEYSVGGGSFMHGTDGGGVYPLMKKMF